MPDAKIGNDIMKRQIYRLKSNRMEAFPSYNIYVSITDPHVDPQSAQWNSEADK